MVYMVKKEEAPKPPVKEEPPVIEKDEGRTYVVEPGKTVEEPVAVEPVEETPAEDKQVFISLEDVKAYVETLLKQNAQKPVEQAPETDEPVEEVSQAEEEPIEVPVAESEPVPEPIEEPVAVEPVAVEPVPVEEPAEEIVEEPVQEEEAEIPLSKDGLLPCPFCGESVDMTYFRKWIIVGHAADCPIGPNAKVLAKDQLIAAWNRRI